MSPNNQIFIGKVNCLSDKSRQNWVLFDNTFDVTLDYVERSARRWALISNEVLDTVPNHNKREKPLNPSPRNSSS